MPGKAAPDVPDSGRASKWKQQSAQLRLAMQANKGGSSGKAAAAMLAETHQVNPTAPPSCRAFILSWWLRIQTVSGDSEWKRTVRLVASSADRVLVWRAFTRLQADLDLARRRP